MLSREQVYTMLLIRKRVNNLFFQLPDELFFPLILDQDPDSEIAKALRLAANGEENALNELTTMLDKNPHLLLQAGNVVTRGGLDVRRVTLYEFFLGAGDPDGAKQIEPYFSRFEGGERQKEKQFERYRPHIKALAKKIKSKQPAYDLRPLIDLIKRSPPVDIAEALNINNPDRKVTRNTPLRAEFAKFRKAVSQKRKTVGMHYEHYTTLIQALDLLYDEWQASTNFTNNNKCLVWRQIIGYLQRSLSAVDRFAFARAFELDFGPGQSRVEGVSAQVCK